MRFVRRRSLLLVGSLVVIVTTLLAVGFFGLRTRRIALSVGVANYVRQTSGLFASLTLTNQGNVSIVAPLRYRCEVESESGSTNFTADTRYTIVLQPGQPVALWRTNFWVPLPAETRQWRLKLQVRQETRRESVIHSLGRWGIATWRRLSKLSGPPKSAETFEWTDVQSGPFEVSQERRQGERAP
ncbi:MAG: hypothetical protein H7A45_17260 [Verrucomicrobiales bacterium]|nr:hypothetical protein [Verrucomicrobiales bacterium]MCP5525600.1 hypothetical protein [Verrucomicrobiales bacterium]